MQYSYKNFKIIIKFQKLNKNLLDYKLFHLSVKQLGSKIC